MLLALASAFAPMPPSIRMWESSDRRRNSLHDYPGDVARSSYYFDKPIEFTTFVTPLVLAASSPAMDRSYPVSTIPVR
jgi:hypothetical protein